MDKEITVKLTVDEALSATGAILIGASAKGVKDEKLTAVMSKILEAVVQNLSKEEFEQVVAKSGIKIY